MSFFSQPFKYFTPLSSYLHAFWGEVRYNISAPLQVKFCFPLISSRYFFLIFHFLQVEYNMPQCRFVLLCLSCQGSVPELQRQLFSQLIPDEWMIMWSVVYTFSGVSSRPLYISRAIRSGGVYVPVSHVALLTALCVQTWAGKAGVDSFSGWWPRFLQAAGTKSEWLFTNAR